MKSVICGIADDVILLSIVYENSLFSYSLKNDSTKIR